MPPDYHRNLRNMCQRLTARLDELATGDSERASVARSYADSVWVEHMQRLERLVLALETMFPGELRKAVATEKPAPAVNVGRQGRLF